MNAVEPLRPGALPALATLAAVPRMLPLALWLPLGGAGRAARAALARPGRLTYRSRRGCAPPPPCRRKGGAGAEGSGRRMLMCSAGRAPRVTRASEGDRERRRLCTLGKPRAD